jgi:lipopolysaccharide transport system permease protein
MHSNTETLVIEAGRAERRYWRDLWHFRELFLFLAWRDIRVRYKQTIFGLAWALLRPLLTMLVFTLVFSKLAKLPFDDAPYPILIFAALLPWQLFSNGVSGAGLSVINNASMISKVYFPRFIIPASAVIVNFVDFMISGIILIGLMIWYGFTPNPRMLIIPIFALSTFAAAMGFGLWAAALSVKYPDFRVIIPFTIQFGLYISPIGFPSNIIPYQWLLLYSLNPMVGQIDAFRWAIIGGNTAFPFDSFFLSVVTIFVTLATGFLYFRNVEKTFADVI